MAHSMCRECHQLVSEEAKTCPRCGVARPVTDDPDAVFAGHRGRLTLVLVLLAIGITWIRHPGDSVQLGAITKICEPDAVDCIPTIAVMCPAPWSPESAKTGQLAPQPLSPREQEWCAANASRAPAELSR